MIRNQKGITTVELLVSLLILSIVLTSSASFYEFFTEKKRDFGSYTTARNLAVSVLETQIEATKLGDISNGEVYRNNVFVNNVNYEIIVTKSDAVDVVSYYNRNVPFLLIKSEVFFQNKSVEVSAYASGI